MDIYNYDESPAQPLDMGAGRLDLTNAADPGVFLAPPSLSFGQVMTGTTKIMKVKVTSAADAEETYGLSTLYTGAGFAMTETTTLPGFVVTPTTITLMPGESEMVTVEFDTAVGMGIGDNQGYIIMEGDNGHDAHMPVWARIAPLGGNEVLIIQNDASSSLGAPNYLDYYTGTLTAMGISYDVWDADQYYDNPTTIPEAAVLSTYKAILYFTGDNYEPDGTYTVSTALTPLDMDRLTEYANGGGILFAMGQDLAAVWSSDATDDNVFAYGFVLGADWLQDSVTGYLTPTLPIGPIESAPPAFDNIFLFTGDPAVVSGDGAANQFYIDEVRPTAAEPAQPAWLRFNKALLKYPGSDNVEDGVVAVSHRDQPSLENPGIKYLGRSIYTTFGLEGVNNTAISELTTREELLGTFMDWAMDEPTVEVEDITWEYSPTGQMAVFTASLSSDVESATGHTYRWDFGDGSPYTPPVDINTGGHDYEYCGYYTVRAEVTDNYGNVAIGELNARVSTSCMGTIYMPLAANGG